MANTSRSTGNLKDKAESMTAAASQMAGEAKEKVQDAASTTTQKAQEMASNVAGKAQEMASNMAGKAQEMASSAAHKTDDALSSVGDKMTSLAGTLREKVPQEGTLGTAAASVADKLQAGGQYLQEHGLEDMAEDLNVLVRRYPMQSILVGLGIGFLVGQAFSRRS